MIQSFADSETERLYRTKGSRRWRSIESIAIRKLDMLNSSVYLADLRIPPGNRLEALRRDRKGQHSIRINDQFRICFTWKDDGAHDVEIVDYH
jgi:proteic killer suppression protein